MKKEIKIIRQILKDYARIREDLELLNARETLISNPTAEVTANHSNLNHAENKFVHHADLSNRLYRIETAIDKIDNQRYQTILCEYIVNKKYKRQDICNMYNISLRSFNDIKNKALLEFAKNYGIDLLSDKTKDNLVYN
ncbi:hypothetical protein CBF86_06760 [Limosilactobacillus reuteri]|uniref:hypothetical protein n=1 Tax=Limosilactobacillus reuteri TaxID=1598 RepID=UPI000B98A1FF|nr:hypothetical protein [Limosilactobacillus reuteri]OYS47326.1 hypothetical protein CBF86_06760 [Limosilactobacillus reuteri]OYS49541.1 hypothetical protein CBF84_05485 [Limosilactobacillus reuteri]OYS51699.1 hypothetical protein CBF92_09580 [Limosilactobacillus reuteri]OYS52882.1 hypothetical protein CBF95_10100 [Limosilactobacillus reuteri]OYS57799.1 hypothetical protein CBF93_08290 [Limosilactobacillus reuteri]